VTSSNATGGWFLNGVLVVVGVAATVWLLQSLKIVLLPLAAAVIVAADLPGAKGIGFLLSGTSDSAQFERDARARDR